MRSEKVEKEETDCACLLIIIFPLGCDRMIPGCD